MRGAPQMRQSVGHKVATKLSAMPRTDVTSEATNTFGFETAFDPVARVGYSQLLKTSLPRPAGYGGSNPDESLLV